MRDLRRSSAEILSQVLCAEETMERLHSLPTIVGALATHLLLQPALAQSPEQSSLPSSSSPLSALDGQFPTARDAKPLSRFEVIALRPGDQFKECAQCPEMVVIPAGEFIMGAPVDEQGSTPDERPQHKVTISKPFAVSRFPVTFTEWDACVAARGCQYLPSDHGWGRAEQPVLDLAWQDAREYAYWLSRATGKSYRLMSEAEREYVTRAGSKTAYWWGDSFIPDRANSQRRPTGPSIADGSDTHIPRVPTRPLPVDRLEPNPWGLYQVHGNVYDWVEDCWHETYDGAPTDGSAWTAGNCSRHVLRGGAFSRNPRTLRSAARLWFGDGNRMTYMSVRIARTLLQ
jgi:formylglycine-generating enzyme required for sulfatase activity